jgi:hypothetical protein
LYLGRFSGVHIGGPSSNQAASLESQTIHPIQYVSARTLRHTPVTGIGHNFQFYDANPSAQYLEIFNAARQDLADRIAEGWLPAASTLTSSFTNASGRVIVNISRSFDANTVTGKFNFHHPVSSVDQALEILRGEHGYVRMTENLEMARELMDSIYGKEDDN